MHLQEQLRKINRDLMRHFKNFLNTPDRQSSQRSETCDSSEKEYENLEASQEIQKNLGFQSEQKEECFYNIDDLLLCVEYGEQESKPVLESSQQNDKKIETRLITLKTLGINQLNPLQKQIDNDINWDLVNPARVKKIFDNKNNPGFS
jgi:hypothetical protein